jgi:hypothetical protein
MEEEEKEKVIERDVRRTMKIVVNFVRLTNTKMKKIQ